MDHRFTHEDVTLDLLGDVLAQANVLYINHDDRQVLELGGDPAMRLALPRDRRWLQFSCDFPLSSSMFPPSSPQMPQPELFHANVIHELFPMLQVGLETDPQRVYRFSYSARLEGGMSAGNLLHCLRTFEDLVRDAIDPLRQKASN